MSDNICANINTCRLVTTNLVVPIEKKREEYMEIWCRKDEKVWGKCSRFITKKALSFCPDFVLPETALSIDEIIDKFDEETP